MGQGLYRVVGFGVVDASQIDWDEHNDIRSLLHTSYETAQNYIMIPFGVDDEVLRMKWTLGPLPTGWPRVGKDGIWVSDRIVAMWEVVRGLAKDRGIDLPAGEPVFACDLN